ncbi:helix-turn-helix domain-containing protein [Methylobacterium gnaphalii]|uniref:Transposase IS30-like HTH domain-containing protein n=1 Tax=Methylobacterium gnaphalii TaxID=1010610 RepID=A0A512JIU8_9HYPH|nr:helix-turn-helix domain-containing protein [Methylobacterium gnaphalii]GEP09876.1 hypothetical protein MGN01_17210 [Methylobacterium gnaphalii]GJD67208.1 hypothetical protein MMMDOFMJ_0122 [Methylobacterium gnaphalii]GLS49905.1 hypothetical protein GCM10007885_27570 [Methylobacterium gnaphalii]
MSKPWRLTEADRERIATMREAGKSCGQIAAAIGCSISAVSWQCLRLGAEPPHPQRLKEVPTVPGSVRRGNHIVRRFTADEDAKLVELEAEGLTTAEISRRLGRPPNSVLGRIMTLARRDARMEASA